MTPGPADNPDYAAMLAARCGPGFMTRTDYHRLRESHDAWVTARDAAHADTAHYADMHIKTSREVFARLETERLEAAARLTLGSPKKPAT